MMFKFKFNRLFFVVLSLSIFTIQAQDSSSESADAIEEVITTARRTEESVTDVPIAISAFTGLRPRRERYNQYGKPSKHCF